MTTDVQSPLPPLSTFEHDHVDRSVRTRELFEQAAACQDPVERDRIHEEIVVLNIGVADALAARYARRGLDPEEPGDG